METTHKTTLANMGTKGQLEKQLLDYRGEWLVWSTCSRKIIADYLLIYFGFTPKVLQPDWFLSTRQGRVHSS